MQSLLPNDTILRTYLTSLCTASDWDCVAAVELLNALHYSVDFIFLSFGIMGFIVELWLAPLNWFKPSSKIFYWPFQGGTSFVDLLCFCSVLCLLCLCARLFICALWSPAGKGLTSWLSFVVSTVSLSLSHWYPESGVVLDCIDS